jgi:uncharacterized protein (DUF302 family)
MSVLVRAPQTRRSDTIRTWGAAVMLAAVAAANADVGTGEAELEPHTAPGRPSDTIMLTTGTGVATTTQRVQDAITSSGGSVVTVVDHTAEARRSGVTIPASTVVKGGSPAGQLPLLRADQRAGVDLPQRYLVRETDGWVGLTVNSDATVPVLAEAVPGSSVPVGPPLIGVTPWEYLASVYGNAEVPTTVERLRRDADRAPTRPSANDPNIERLAADSDRLARLAAGIIE